MIMTMVQIRKVRMAVHDRFVPVPVSVFDLGQRLFAMGMLMMFIVFVIMGVFYRLVQMFMAMLFRQMQPHPNRHQSPRQQ